MLEYCKGGDLSMYIQRHGRVPEAIAKHFMQQLGMSETFSRCNAFHFQHLWWLSWMNMV